MPFPYYIWGGNGKKLLGNIDWAMLNFQFARIWPKRFYTLGITTREKGPQNVQGVLALATRPMENMGGFSMYSLAIPKLWYMELVQPEDRDHFKPDVSDLQEKIVKVKDEAGDLFNI